MRHYATVRTIHRDGTETICRIRCDSQVEARDVAYTKAIEFHGEDAVGVNKFWEQFKEQWLENDFGEPVNIRDEMQGEFAQVREGVFTISVGGRP